jgi:AbrB family looped-hinge helix DNA binding protein
MKALTLDKQGRFTVPAEVRLALQLSPGDRLMFEPSPLGWRVSKLAPSPRRTKDGKGRKRLPFEPR